MCFEGRVEVASFFFIYCTNVLSAKLRKINHEQELLFTRTRAIEVIARSGLIYRQASEAWNRVNNDK